MARSISLSMLLHRIAPVPEDVMLSGISLDSRNIKPGDLFVACGGSTVHGASFIPQAVQSGAAAVLLDTQDAAQFAHDVGVPVIAIDNLLPKVGAIASEFYANPSAELKLLAVTGTNGKTTVTHLLAYAINSLCRQDNACGIIGTLGYAIGANAGSRQKLANTTPDAIQLQSLLHDLRQQQAGYVALEASSHALAQYRLHGSKLAAAVLTNISRDHLDYHLTMEQYAACKQRLFGFPELQLAILNADCEYAMPWARQGSADKVYMYGLDKDHLMAVGAAANVAGCLYGSDINISRTGSSITIHDIASDTTLACASKLIGSFNVSHILAAATTLHAMGFALPQVLAALASAPAVPGRMESFTAAGSPLVMVDYAHNPDALRVVLGELRQLADYGKLYCVFGCGGERDRGKRPMMGAVANELADEIVITSDNPRGEKVQDISRDILSGMAKSTTKTVRQIDDRKEAIAYAISAATEKDVVLVAGKGHEATQNINGQLLPCDDREIVQKLLGLAA